MNGPTRVYRVMLVGGIVAATIGCVSLDQRLANTSFSYIEHNRLVEAEGVLTRALATNPVNPYALLNMGATYQRTRRFDRARTMFAHVISLSPQEVPARRSPFIDPSWTLTQIAEYNLTILPR